MDLPFHPIVYVNREVVVAQDERANDDMRVMARPDMVQAGNSRLSSLGMGLGMDQNLFVMHAIHDSQQVSGRLAGLVDGRHGRVDLGSEGYLPSPGLRGDTAIDSFGRLREKPAAAPSPGDGAREDQEFQEAATDTGPAATTPDADGGTDMQVSADDAGPVDEAERTNDAQDASDDTSSDAAAHDSMRLSHTMDASAMMPAGFRTSPSFTEQLRSGAARLPARLS